MALENGASSRSNCIHCGSDKLRTVLVLAKEGFPPGHPRYYIAYSHDAVFACGECGHGYAEKRRRDSFDWEDDWDKDQTSAIGRESILALEEGLAGCPEPTSEACECEIHKSLRSSWNLLGSVWSGYNAAFAAPILRAAGMLSQESVPRIGVEFAGGVLRFTALA